MVDTGLHYYQWTREEAIDYLMENTPSSRDACRIAIDRYIVIPGQATAYMIGKLRILKQRKKAMKQLGDQFKLREFHDAILTKGALPLEVFDDVVAKWISEK